MIDPQGSPIDVPGVIEESIGIAGAQAGQREVAIVAEYPAHLPAVSGDRERLVRVAGCLLQQAKLFSSHDQVTIRAALISAGEGGLQNEGAPTGLLTEDAGPWVLLTITFGVGSDSAGKLRQWVEGPADSANWVDPECGARLAKYADRFWYASSDEEGRFNLALPIWAAYEVSAGPASLREAVISRLPNPEEAGHSLLLLVDDDDIRAELARDLGAAGYRVLPASSGEEVLPLARNEQPALILLDLIARSPTAFEVAGLLKHDRRTRNLPVLFLTSLEDAQGATEMGTVGFLPRQPDTGAVISAINAVLTSGLKPLSRVLIVEQDEHLRDHMVMTIQSQGYRVSEASGPEEAMALAERATPEVALVNAKLAQERDYWLLRGLRNTARQAEIYVMADVLDEDEAKAALRRGASGYSETGQLPNLLDKMRRREDPE